MKLLPLILLLAAAVVAVGQDTSIPVLQGTATYSMPQSAIDAGIAGTVMVAIRVDDTGKPTNAAVVSGPMWPCGTTPIKALEDLLSSISESMMKLRFTPAIENGKPVTKDVGLRLELRNSRLSSLPVATDPATGKPKPTMISGGVLNGKATYLPKPQYPSAARANRDSGAVTIQVLIDESGKVIRAGAVSGRPTLQFAAREAACASKFSPITLKGYPVKVAGVITYAFIP